MEPLRRWGRWLRGIAPERFVLLALLLCAGILWYQAVILLPRPLEVVVFSMGKGEAILLRGPHGRTVLIDGGSSSVPDPGARRLVPNLLLLGVKRLDAVVVTHPDSDHVNGLAAVLEALPVDMLLEGQPGGNDATPYQQLLAAAALHRVPCRVLRAGARLELGDRAVLRVLAPGDKPLTATASDVNNNSVVCRLEYRRASMLFTGDLEAEGEARLLANGQAARADVLKVAHHGSRNGTGDALLAAVQPYMAVISSPGGSGDHPHAETLARLRARQVRVVRTDVSGRIRLRTSGAGWQVETYRQPREMD